MGTLLLSLGQKADLYRLLHSFRGLVSRYRRTFRATWDSDLVAPPACGELRTPQTPVASWFFASWLASVHVLR